MLSTFMVTSTADTAPAGNPTTGTLRWAIEKADTAASPSTIAFSLNTPATIGLLQGPLALTNQSDMTTIQGPGAALLFISGSNQSQVFQVASGVTASFSNLTITKGVAVSEGGGLYNLGTLSLTDCTISGNSAFNGAGLYNERTLNLYGCTVSNNTATANAGGLDNAGTATVTDCTFSHDSGGAKGGGVDSSPNSKYPAILTLTGCTVSGNSGGAGGGLFNYGQATLTDCSLSGNTADEGGGLWDGPPAQATATGCTFSGDSASGDGGGIFNDGGTLDLDRCTVSGGSAQFEGGGLSNISGTTQLLDSTVSGNTCSQSGGGVNNRGTATLTECTVSGNTASHGGGLYNVPPGSQATAFLTLIGCTVDANSTKYSGAGLLNFATASLTDSTVSGNSASQGTGPIRACGAGVANYGPATLTACTVSGNTASNNGGGIYNYINSTTTGTATLIDTIVASNLGGGGPSDVDGNNSGAVTGSNDLIGIGGSGGIAGGSDRDIVLTTLTGLDLAPLADYGGPTETIAVLPGSPAIGAGIAVTGVTTDQRGFALDLPNPDIGAFQSVLFPLVVSVATDGVGAPPGEMDLRGAVNLANIQTGAHTISFDATAFATGQTITLTEGQFELSNTSGQITITGPAAGVTVSGDQASRVFQIDKGVTASISGLTITEGSTSASGGGSYAGYGGGLLNLGTATLTACTISDNSSGGNLDNEGTVTLIDSTLAGSTGDGLINQFGKANLIACTVTGNHDVGLANYGNSTSSGTISLTDTIVAGNTLNGAPSDIGGIDPADVTGSYNLVGTGGTGGLIGSDHNLLDVADPGLAPLGDYGGPTQTVALLPGSPAIGAGIAVNGVTRDQRGVLFGSPPDIGAFESQGISLKAVAGSTPQSAATGDAFASPLAVTVTANDPLEPVAGGLVTFTVNPASNGSSASLSGTIGIIGASGMAEVTATANSTAGSYTVTASAAGAAGPVVFSLKNLISLTFSVLTDQSITYGTSSVTVNGTLANGLEAPQGTNENVAVTLDGVEQQAAIGSGGAFSTTFNNTAGLTVSGSPYTIRYSYTSDETFASASTTSSLTVTKASPVVSVSDPGGTYHNTAFPATATVAGVSGSAASSLEGVSPSLSYYSGTYTNPAQLNGLTPLSGPPSQAGSYTVLAGFAGSTDYTNSSTLANFTITRATPTVSVADAGGTYSGTAFATTDAVTGVSGSPSSSLEGVTPSLTYYSGIYTSASQLSGLTPLSAAPSQAGSYTVLASFAGSTDYTAGSALANFTITQATPAVGVSDPGGTYNDLTSPASATVTGVGGSAVSSLEGVSPSLAYYSGTYTSASQLAGLTPLSAAPSQAGAYTVLASFAGSTDYTTGSALANFTIARATPTVRVSDAGGTYSSTAFPATDAVAGISGSGSSSLEGVSPSLSYYSGTYTSASQLAGLTPLSAAPSQAGSYTVLASFAGSTDYATGSALANFTIARAAPTVSVADAGGTYSSTAFPATDAVAGISGSGSSSLEGVSPSLSYYS
ncbi:MAG: beta strand repeat-containing protein, partial [Isosphaerales bacterium]